MIDMNDNQEKHTFYANTSMGWLEFKDRVLSQFKTNHYIHLEYCISGSGDFRGIVDLGCQSDWMDAMTWIKEKVLSARMRTVTMELKNMVSDIFSA